MLHGICISILILLVAAGTADAEEFAPDPRTAPPAALPAVPDGRLQAAYGIWYGGFRVFALDVQVEIAEDRYRMAVEGRPQGMLAWAIDGMSRAESEGVRTETGGPRPVRYASESDWRDRVRTSEVRFDAEGRAAAIALTPPADDARLPVPETARIGPDPLSAVIWAIEGGALRGSDAAPATVTVFDGKRTVALEWRCGGTDTLSKGFGVYSGPAVLCRIDGEQTAGFHKEYADRNLKLPYPAKLWLAPVEGRDWHVPVRLQMDTQYGALIAHLVAVGEDAVEIRAQRDAISD